MNFYCEPYGCKMSQRACGKRHMTAVAKAEGKRMAGDATGASATLDSVRHCLGCVNGQQNKRFAALNRAPTSRPRRPDSNITKVLKILRGFGRQVTHSEILVAAKAQGMRYAGASLFALKKRGDAVSPRRGVWEAVNK